MTERIVELESYRLRAKKADHVWQCKCGGQHFYLIATGEVQCRDCSKIISGLIWGKCKEER